MRVGATKVPCAHSAGSGRRVTRPPLACIAATWASSPARASESITGPMSTRTSAGLPRRSSASAPCSMCSTPSAMSCCRHSTRSAEQRWPAESKAEASTSPTTCSGSAVESTIIAFWPPVSAISGTLPPRSASLRLISAATSVEPVNITPRTRASATSAAPTVSPRPGSSCSTAAGMPASCSRRTAKAAISGVCSAGLASTGLPAASAAATWPLKMASGKFHGLMHSTGPSGTWLAASKPRACWA